MSKATDTEEPADNLFQFEDAERNLYLWKGVKVGGTTLVPKVDQGPSVKDVVAKTYFEEPRWCLEHTVRVIALRTIEAFAGRDLHRIKLLRARAILRRNSNAVLVSKNPVAELLAVLRSGKIRAIAEDHSKLPAAFWDKPTADLRTWPDVRFEREDVLKLFRFKSSDTTVDEAKGQPIKPATRGRKRRIPQEEVDAVVFVHHYAHGDLSGDDPDWHTQGQIERAASAALVKKFGTKNVVQESTLRLYIVKSFEKWKEKKGR